MLRHLIMAAIVALLLCGTGQNAYAVKIEDGFCNLQGYESAKRQTLILIDGQLVVDEPDGKRAKQNQVWREFVANLLNTRDPAIGQNFAPREQISIGILEVDGSGVRQTFRGCIPTYSKEESDALSASGSAVDEFFGRGWKANLADAQDRFRRKMVLSLVDELPERTPLTEIEETVDTFARGSLTSSISRGLGINVELGVPRIIILTKLSVYTFPATDPVGARKTGRVDSERLNLDLQHAEVHLFGADGSEGSSGTEYLRAFFLSGKGKLETISGRNGALQVINPPQSVRVFQGKVVYPDGSYPMRIRLSLDRNGIAVNSWAEVVSDRNRYSPFSGILTCESDEHCQFIGDRVFAQIWSDDPDPEPEFENWMPFAGFRQLEFELRGNRITGSISDSSGFVEGMEDGLKFELNLVPGGLF